MPRQNVMSKTVALRKRKNLILSVLTALLLAAVMPMPAQEAGEQQTRRMLESILRSAPSGIGVVIDRVIVQVNDYILDLTGYSREELIGQSARMLYPTQEESDYVGTEKYRQINENGTGSVETRWRRKDGTIRHVILSSTPLDPSDLSQGVTFTVLDISERKVAEAALAWHARWDRIMLGAFSLILLFLLIRLAASRMRHRAAAIELEKFFSVNLDLLCIADLEGNFVKTNEAWSRILGYSTQDLNKKKFLEFVHPDDIQATLDVMAKLGQGEDVLNFTNRYCCKDGSYRQIEWRSHPKGNLIYAAARDITERKRMEEALQESEKRLDLAMAVKNEGVWDWNLVSNEAFFDERYYIMAGYAPSEFPQHFAAWAEHVHPDDLPHCDAAIKAYLAGQSERFDIEFRFKHKDGSWIWIQGRGRIVGRDENGSPLRMIGTHTDITERKQAEMALRESEAKFRSIIENSPVGFHIYTLDTEGRLVFSLYNLAADTILRTSHESFVGRDILEAFPALAGTGIPEMYAAVARGELETQNFEVPYHHGGIRGVYEVRVFQGAPGQAVVNFVDISERKLAEEAIEAARKQLETKNKELEQLIYVASHDLRSPLVNVDGFGRELEYSLGELIRLLEKGNLEALEKALRREFPDMGKSLERIRVSTRQMDNLLKGLLKLSRSGRAALQIEMLDMNELLSRLIPSFAYRVREGGIEMTVELLPPCRGDSGQLTQVFSNLIDNAIKYCDKKKPGIITIKGVVTDGRAVYRVEDNGRGIAVNHRENIFELFHRINPGETEGEGLGLTLVRQILGRLDGEISVESASGEGSAFIVSLPGANGGNP